MTAPDMTGLNNLGLGKEPTGVLPEGISSCGTVDSANNKMSGGSKSKKAKGKTNVDKKKKVVKKPITKPKEKKAKKSILKTIKNDLVSVGVMVEKKVKKLFTGKSKKVEKKPIKKDKKPVKKDKNPVKKDKNPVKKVKKTSDKK